MKKIIFLLIISFSFNVGFAQKANVRKAKDKVLMDTPDFTAAREAINLALKDSTTKDQAETWYVAGLIGNKESEVQYKKAILNMPFDTLKKGRAMMESYDYLIQAIKLDNLPDAKGKVKPKFAKNIKSILKDYYQSQPNLIGYGAYQFGKEDYAGAVKTFETYMAIPKLPLMNNEIKMDSTYEMITFYAAVAAANAKMYSKAIKIYQDLKDKKYQTAMVYQNLAQCYLSQKDTVTYVNTLKEGIDKYPTKPWFLQSLINHYIHINKIQDALTYLNTAIEREPGFAQYQYVKGQLYLSLENFDDAITAFKKTLELDPKMAEAYAEIGRSYYNRAVKLTLAANNIKDVNQYKAEKKKIDLVFNDAIPYYKKAIEIDPKNVDYKIPLKQLYYQLQMDAEYDAINKEIKALQ